MSIRLIDSDSESDGFQLLDVRLMFADALWHGCNGVSVYDICCSFFGLATSQELVLEKGG